MAPLRILSWKSVPDTRSILPFRTFLYNLWIRVLDHHSPSTPIRMGWYKSNVSVGQIPLFIAKAIPFFTSRGEFPSTHFQRLLFDQPRWEHPRARWPRYLALWRFKPPLSCYDMSFFGTSGVNLGTPCYNAIHLLNDELLGVASPFGLTSPSTSQSHGWTRENPWKTTASTIIQNSGGRWCSTNEPTELVILGDSFNHLHSWGEKHGVSEAAQVEPPQYFMGRWGRPQYVACFFLFSAGNRDILRIDSFLDVFSHTTWNTQMHFSISSRELNHRFQQSLRHPVWCRSST